MPLAASCSDRGTFRRALPRALVRSAAARQERVERAEPGRRLHSGLLSRSTRRCEDLLVHVHLARGMLRQHRELVLAQAPAVLRVPPSTNDIDSGHGGLLLGSGSRFPRTARGGDGLARPAPRGQLTILEAR